jgi:TPR repeat protein
MYGNGQGVPQSYAEALKWFRKAANQGNAAAQFNLGLMYRMGQGVPQNYVLAHMWFNLAISQFPMARCFLRCKMSAHGRISAALSVAKLPRQPLTDAAVMTQRWGNRLAATAAR